LTRRNRIDPRRIKINRSFTIEELARTLRCSKNCIRLWMKQGLALLEDARRPLLIHGSTARAFLEARKKAGKRKCQLSELFCLKCKAPRQPADSTVDYRPSSEASGMLSALCPTCSTPMFKCVSAAALPAIEMLLRSTQSECARTAK
jgi:hypothetical protein